MNCTKMIMNMRENKIVSIGKSCESSCESFYLMSLCRIYIAQVPELVCTLHGINFQNGLNANTLKRVVLFEKFIND